MRNDKEDEVGSRMVSDMREMKMKPKENNRERTKKVSYERNSIVTTILNSNHDFCFATSVGCWKEKSTHQIERFPSHLSWAAWWSEADRRARRLTA